MKKLHTYYSSILWASALTTLVGCNYHRKNGMMDGNNSPSEAGVHSELINEKPELTLASNI